MVSIKGIQRTVAMNITNSMTKVLAELLKLTDNVGNSNHKEKSKSKAKGIAGKSAGFKR